MIIFTRTILISFLLYLSFYAPYIAYINHIPNNNVYVLDVKKGESINKVLSKFSLNNLLINKKLLEELGRLLIDFAGQSDTFIFDSQEKRRLIIDDLCSQELKDTSTKIKNLWEESQYLRGLINEEKNRIF